MDEKPKQTFLLNLSTRTIHDLNSLDGRCKINTIQDGNSKVFDSYKEAKNYLPDGKKTAKPCSFCLGKNYENNCF